MKRILIKLGGSSLQNPSTIKELVKLVKGLQLEDYRVVIVHGGGPAINQELTSRGITWQFINGQRQTTPEMMSVIEEVLAVKINSMLVDILRAADVQAYGLSGAQNKTLFCTQANAELMQVGSIQNVNVEDIENVICNEADSVAVIAPIGVGSENEKYNINADWAATKIAVALQVEKLIFLTDQNGVLDANKELVKVLTPQLTNEMIEAGIISGGMFTKVNTMLSGLREGIGQVRVLNAGAAGELLKTPDMGTVLINS